MCLLGWGRRLPAGRRGRRQEGARCALLLICSVHVLIYAGYFAPSTVKVLIQEDLRLTDLQTSLPNMALVVACITTAPAWGALADARLADRRAVLACAVAFWSLATVLTGLARNLAELVVLRSLTGVVQAAFISICPPLLADFFPLHERNLVLTVYFFCIPLGASLGGMGNSLAGAALGWRWAFVICGAPAAVLAGLLPALNDPARGANDADDATEGAGADEESPEGGMDRTKKILRDLRDILGNPHWICVVAGIAGANFMGCSMTEWQLALTLRTFPAAGVGEVGSAYGLAGLFGGVCGNLLNVHAIEPQARRWPGAHFLLPAGFMLAAAALCFLCVNVAVGPVATCVLLALMWSCFHTFWGPINTAALTSIPVHLRSRAAGLQILITQVLGDLLGPATVGALSDASGSLRAAMQILWVITLVPVLSWGVGYFCLSPLPQALDDGAGSSHGAPGLASLLCSDEGADWEAEGAPADRLLSGPKREGYATVKGA